MVLLVLMMLLMLLIPRVSAQRYVCHVAQPVVVDTVFGLRRRWAVVAEPKFRHATPLLSATDAVAVVMVDWRERPCVDGQRPLHIAG